MGYVVTRPSGITDAEFQESVRLLRQQGLNIGHRPRVLDPTGRQWLYVRAARAAAQGFAHELNEQTANEGWEVEGRPSEGPLGRSSFRSDRREGPTALDELFRSRLRDLMTGRVRVHELDLAPPRG